MGDSITEELLVPYQNVAGLLPNVTYRDQDQSVTEVYAEALVLGSVESVEEGAAFVATKAEPDGEEIPFDSPEAAWRTLEAIFVIDELLAGQVNGDSIVLQLSADGDEDPAEVAELLMSMAQLALSVKHVPPTNYFPESYWVVHSNTLFIAISPSGELSLPALPDAEAENMLGQIDTLDELRSVAAQEPEVRPAVAVGEALLAPEDAPPPSALND